MPHVHIFWEGSTVTSMTLAARIKHSLKGIHEDIIIQNFQKTYDWEILGILTVFQAIHSPFRNVSCPSFQNIPTSYIPYRGTGKTMNSYCSQPFGNQNIFK